MVGGPTALEMANLVKTLPDLERGDGRRRAGWSPPSPAPRYFLSRGEFEDRDDRNGREMPTPTAMTTSQGRCAGDGRPVGMRRPVWTRPGRPRTQKPRRGAGLRETCAVPACRRSRVDGLGDLARLRQRVHT